MFEFENQNELFDEEQYEGFYDKAKTDVDLELESFVKNIRKGICKEFLDEMETLKKRNKYLSEQNDRISKELCQVKNKVRQQENSLNDELKNVASLCYTDLIQKFPAVAWRVDCKSRYKTPKCDKCNSEREIEFFSPRGIRYTECCLCAEREYFYYVTQLNGFEFEKRNDKATMFYYAVSDPGGSPDSAIELKLTHEDWKHKETKNEFNYNCDNRLTVSDNTPFEKISRYDRPVFLSKSKAERYALYMNKKNGWKSDVCGYEVDEV